MGYYLPTRDEINSSWFERWGETFGSPALATKVLSNDRTSQIAQERMFTALGIDTKADIKPEDINAAQAYGADKKRLAHMCGMVIHGEFLRTCISKSDFEILSSVFTIEDLKTAISLSHLHQKQSDFTADMAKIEMLIEHSGKACISSWKTSLDEQIGMRIYLMETNEEQEEEFAHTIESSLARAIVIAVSNTFISETSLKAA